MEMSLHFHRQLIFTYTKRPTRVYKDYLLDLGHFWCTSTKLIKIIFRGLNGQRKTGC